MMITIRKGCIGRMKVKAAPMTVAERKLRNKRKARSRALRGKS